MLFKIKLSLEALNSNFQLDGSQLDITELLAPNYVTSCNHAPNHSCGCFMKDSFDWKWVPLLKIIHNQLYYKLIVKKERVLMSK